MVTDQQTILSEFETTFDSPDECRPRFVQDLPAAIRSALRRVVHDYVTGWGIVGTQSPSERRRKKRLWDRRTSERHTLRRPVWVHKARWGESFSDTPCTVVISRREEMYLVRDISDSGIGLTSDTPPKSRLVVLAFDSWRGQPTELLVQLRWRKRIDVRNYYCGGVILGVLMPE